MHARLPLAIAAILATALPARAKLVPVAGIAVSINGDRSGASSADPGIRALHEFTTASLEAHGFTVLASADAADLIGGASLEGRGLAWLEIVTHDPKFSFNVVLLAPRAKAAELKLVDPRTRAVLWQEVIKVPLNLPEGDPRREAGRAALRKTVGELRPRPGLPVRNDPFLAGLLELNSARLDPAALAQRARAFSRAEAIADPAMLVDLAADPRLEPEPDLRAELLRRSIIAAGPAIQPALGRALSREIARRPEGSPLVDRLVEGFELIGASAGDALAPALLQAPLEPLLAARRRWSFRQHRDAIDSRIESLGLAAIRSAAGFAAAAELTATLPVERMSVETRAALRGELYSRVEVALAREQAARIERLVPGPQGGDAALARLDQRFLEQARALAASALETRLQYFQGYLAAVPEGAAAEPIARSLGIESVLEAALLERLKGARDARGEREALRAVYGPGSGPLGRETLVRSLLARLGGRPPAEEVQKLLARHPDLPELQREAVRLGAVRDREAHVFEMNLGDGEGRLLALFGRDSLRRDPVNRRDVSPQAFITTREKVPALTTRGWFALDVERRCRVLFKDGKAERIQLQDLGGRYHHGIRDGDRREDAIAVLGEPTHSRALMFGREVLTWKGLHGGSVVLVAVMDGKKVAFFYEESEDTARELIAGVR